MARPSAPWATSGALRRSRQRKAGFEPFTMLWLGNLRWEKCWYGALWQCCGEPCSEAGIEPFTMLWLGNLRWEECWYGVLWQCCGELCSEAG